MISIITISNNKRNLNKGRQITDPALLRALTYEEFSDEDSDTNSDYVKFGAYFAQDLYGDGYAHKIKGTCNPIGGTSRLYIDINIVENGYFKNGVINISNSNFSYALNELPGIVVKSGGVGKDVNKIELNSLNSGTQKLFVGNISSKLKNLNDYSKTVSIILTGTHVDDNGTETEVYKEVQLQIDWYGNIAAELPTAELKQSGDINKITDTENEKINLNASIVIKETRKELLLKNVYVEAVIPKLSGYAPLEVKVTNSDYEYDEETGILKISKEAKLRDNVIISKCESGTNKNNEKYNNFSLKISYPFEAYESYMKNHSSLSISIPVKGYYVGFNNDNEEFNSLIQSNWAENILLLSYYKPVGKIAKFEIEVIGEGKSSFLGTEGIIPKTNPIKLYNKDFIEMDQDYRVEWKAITASEVSDGVIMKDSALNSEPNPDYFIASGGSRTSLEDISYIEKIRFSNLNNALYDDGWVCIYDDVTNQLIKKISSKEYGSVDAKGAKHIRIETSKVKEQSTFTVTLDKRLDDEKITEVFTKQQFDGLYAVESRLYGYKNSSLVSNVSNTSKYELSKCNATIDISEKNFSSQDTKNANINVNLSGGGLGDTGWKDSEFLIKIPRAFVFVEVEDIVANKRSYNSDYEIVSWDLEEIDGDWFIRVYTKSEDETGMEFTINCNLTPDPRIISNSPNIALYAHNNIYYADYGEKGRDIYDVDNDLNKSESVYYTGVNVNIDSPSSLLTSEYITDFEDTGKVAVAPNVAELTPESNKATINILTNNNYNGSVENLLIMGKIPFEGNRYNFTDRDIGSNFSTTMTNEGILVPENLREKVEVYYTYNENPTKYLSDANNNWTKTPDDYSKVKCYLIDFGDSTINYKDSYVFSYKVNIPENLTLNNIAYSNHSVSYYLQLGEGRIKKETEPNKVGLMPTKKINI